MKYEHYYKLDTAKAFEIARLLGYQVPEGAEKVAAFCCADWPEGDEHQAWLNTAPAEEIANWMQANDDRYE